MKKSLIMGLAVSVVFSMENAAFAAADNPFATVPSTHWGYQYIEQLVHAGLIDGYVDGDFRGDKPATRYELAVLTAKAMFNMEKADQASKVEIEQLEIEFKEELVQLNVRIPGVAAPVPAATATVPPAATKADQIKWSGNIRLRYDHKTDSNSKGDTTATGVKDTSYYYELTGTTAIGGGWNGLIRLLGARDRDGQDRGGQENTNGQFDMSRLYFYGPVGNGTLKVGRDKAGAINGMVMNEYYTGAVYSFGNKAKVNVTYGKPDYNSTTRNTTGEAISKDDRGINESYINPKNVGINYVQLDVKYPLDEKTNLYAGLWRTMANNKNYKDPMGNTVASYKNTNIWELAFDRDIVKNLNFGADYARSDRAENNVAYNFSLAYRQANKVIPHSWSTELDYVHLEDDAYIKSTFDIKNNKTGSRGWQLIYKYVPTKNVLWTTRWLQSKDLTGTDPKSEKWLRSQFEFFF
ncbi:MAG: putative outer membrane protein [Massilibacillus sp.]|jgi:hypothetical protein|nr:putative outer membrane protein [Massilibacillus sp.]